jgi:hypothetical protein
VAVLGRLLSGQKGSSSDLSLVPDKVRLCLPPSKTLQVLRHLSGERQVACVKALDLIDAGAGVLGKVGNRTALGRCRTWAEADAQFGMCRSVRLGRTPN